MNNNTSQILDRLLQGAGFERDRQLADFLGVSPQAVSQARRKDKIPDRWILQIASRFHLSPEWLFRGEGTPRDKALPGSIPSKPVSLMQGHQRRGVARLVQSEHSTLPPVTSSAQSGGPPAGNGGMLPPPEIAMVPLVEASLAAGQGSLATSSQVQGYFAFRQDWLLRKGNPERMVLMKVFGDSMEPDIRHGDMVLVDQGHTQIFGHAIYAVGVNDEIYIKQVETRPGSKLVLLSFNERYAPIEVNLHGDLAESVRIIGRIIWWCREA